MAGRTRSAMGTAAPAATPATNPATEVERQNFWTAHHAYYLSNEHNVLRGRTTKGRAKADVTVKREIPIAAIPRMPTGMRAEYARNQKADGSALPAIPPNEAFEGAVRPTFPNCTQSCCAPPAPPALAPAVASKRKTDDADPEANASAEAGSSKRPKPTPAILDTDHSDHDRVLFNGRGYSTLPAPEHRHHISFGAIRLEMKKNIYKESTTRTWYLVEHIGSGSYGACDLFCLVNDADKSIVDRLIIKRQPIRYPDEITSWYKGWELDDKGFLRRDTPLEAWIHQELTKAGDAKDTNIAPLITWFYNQPLLTLHLYMEYHEHTSLRDLFPFEEWFKKKATRNHVRDGQVPEPYVWWILRSLIKACLVLDRGHIVGADAEKPADWHSVVHRDIKPENILMGGFDDDPLLEGLNVKWPRTLLTDFGSSRELRCPPFRNPEDFQGTVGGTRGFLAPEQADVVRGGIEPMPFGPWTNVFAIGLVGYELTRDNISLTLDKVYPCRPGEGQAGNIHFTSNDYLIWGTDAMKDYSDELRDFLDELTGKDIDARPKLNEALLDVVTGHFKHSMTIDRQRNEASAWRPFKGYGFVKDLPLDKFSKMGVQQRFEVLENYAVGKIWPGNEAEQQDDDDEDEGGYEIEPLGSDEA